MPDFTLQYKRAYLETLVRVQTDSAIRYCAGVCPVKKIGIRSHAGVVLRETDGFVFDDFTAVEGTIGLLLFRNDSDCHDIVFNWKKIRKQPIRLTVDTR